jgi:hypothetical protein
MRCGLAIFLTSKASTVVPESAHKLHSSNTAKVTHVLSDPEAKILGRALQRPFHHIPVYKVKAICQHSEMIRLYKEVSHCVIVDSMHHLFGGVGGTLDSINPTAPTLKLDVSWWHRNLFLPDTIDPCLSLGIHYLIQLFQMGQMFERYDICMVSLDFDKSYFDQVVMVELVNDASYSSNEVTVFQLHGYIQVTGC